jgi:hypothetical protein
MSDQPNERREEMVLADARFAMQAHRLTYAIVQTRLREAAFEEAEEQVAHLEDRIAALAPLNSADARRVMMLPAEVDRLHALSVAGELDRVLATLIPTMEAIGARGRGMRELTRLLGHFMGEERAGDQRNQESKLQNLGEVR